MTLTPSPRTGGATPRVCVGIATRGRPEQLAAMIDNLRFQTLAPESIIVCCTGPQDVGAATARPGVRVIYEQPGLARQRNGVLRALPEGTDFLVFFDDDFYPHPRWIETVVDAFQKDPVLACVTGHVVADGILGPGLTREEALAAIAAHDPAASDWVVEGYSPYGCNMAFRCATIAGLTFDERLVLYGWLEDRDFGAAVAQRGGRLIKLGTAVGVHLGVKGGRVSGRKLGYSQVMNPVYMHRKSTMTTAQVLRQIARNIAANLTKSIRPEPYVDRRGRLLGNLIAALDLLRLRLTPERAASL
ncbi:glycosyltransferase family 2 protein [Methylobacterium organophilum]|uniref:Glycosyltransferase 2-like domain-containing protein n=1 Tax=Methylobacterium organophilum TaxID=410 RepID=A0ABQ4TB37_METOR|nr:glycosyltransferase [Methylobacterium organophilum]UMY16008.1 glycosyltransferase [Methylobacterium organophilum]GJE28448.1 hypothetical protein LKMONMHP_3319 [Methylobacterium organophilum]